LGRKVSIVSQKVQTTYHGVSGILNLDSGQLVFTDTPGYQKHPDRVARLLNNVADQKAAGCDAVMWVFDASNPRVFQQVMKLKTKISQLKKAELSFCVLNKVDKVEKTQLLPLIQSLWELGIFKEIIPVSAKKGNGMDRLVQIANQVLPEGDELYPRTAISDRNPQFHLAEFVREKIYQATHEEVPYSSWIEIDESEGPRMPMILAKIHVDSESKKGILIGKKGEMLKKIGIEARKEMEAFLGKQICLKLHVHVQKKWKEDSRFVNRYLELDQ
jgi:GTP-binding protein Era